MKRHFFKTIRIALSAGAITLLIAAGISGCGVNAHPGLTPPAQPSASSKVTIVTPQPGSRQWNEANYGDSGL
jgi:hypothetical protein